MKKVLITGVAGMIGSHLLDCLIVKNYEIIGIDDLSFGKTENIKERLGVDRFKFYRVDVGDFETLKILRYEVEIIKNPADKHVDILKTSPILFVKIFMIFQAVPQDSNLFRFGLI